MDQTVTQPATADPAAPERELPIVCSAWERKMIFRLRQLRELGGAMVLVTVTTVGAELRVVGRTETLKVGEQKGDEPCL